MSRTAPPAPGAEAALRDQISNLQALLVLSMLMTESSQEGHILKLAGTSVASLGPYSLRGVRMTESGWQAPDGPLAGAEARVDVEAQLAVLSQAGGAVAVPGDGWAWAFPLRSLGGHFGFMVVGADSTPSASGQFLLRVLAQQTGVALANARLHEGQRETALELGAANAVLAETVAVLEQGMAIHTRLTAVAAAGEGQEGIVRAVHELTRLPVAAEDHHGNLRAWAGPGRPEDYPRPSPAERQRLVEAALRAGTPIRDGDRLVAIAGPRADILGVLALVDPGGTAGAQERVALEHGATVLALELARLQGLAEIEMRLGRDLVEALLAGADRASSLERARALGHDLERPHRVIVIESRLGADGLAHAVRLAARAVGAEALLSIRGRHAVLVCEGEVSWEHLRRSVDELVDGECRLGVGAVCARPEEIPRSHREARLALRMLDVAAAGGGVARFEDLGVYRILAEAEDTASVERFVRGWLGPLIDYDESGRADLVNTLSRYLDFGRSHDATARALVVHRSTLKYRLRRIAELTGYNLSDPDTAFNLQLATRARRTLLALRADRVDHQDA